MITHRFAPSGAPAGFGVVFLALALALFASPAQAADDYPRLGLYGHTDGRGLPVIKANGQIDAQLLDNIARHHMVVIDATPFTEYRPDMLPALRARRHGIKVLAYVQAQYIFEADEADSSVNLPTRIRNLVRNMGGLLYNQTGVEYDAANINLAKRDAQGRYVVAEALADFFIDHVLVPGSWDGLYFDRYCTTLAWMQAPGAFVDHVRAGYPSFAAFDAAWSAGTDTLANRMRRRAGSTPMFIGNCGQGNKYAAFNGWMRENFPYQNGGTWQTNMFWDPGGYLTDQARFLPPYAGWMTAWPTDNVSPYSTENMRRARYVLGTAALGDAYGSINPPDINPMTGYMDWWYDEFAVNRITGASTSLIGNTGWLGRADGPMRQMMWIQPGVEDAGQPNPGFESSLAGWVFLTSNGSTLTRDASTAGDGLASARITIPAAGDPSTARLTGTTSVAYVNDQYSATFWAKASVPRTIGVLTVHPTTGVPVWWNLLSIDTTWRRYQVVFNGTSGSVKLEFRLGAAGGDVWFDDVHFQRGVPNIYRRDFDYGTVLVNPANKTWNVALERSFRRLVGTRDPIVNNGSTSSLFSMGPNSALFLLKPVAEVVGAGDPPAGAASSPLAWSAASPSPARAGSETVRLVLAVPAAGDALVDLHDARGRLIRRLHVGPLAAGSRTFAWDGRDEAGRTVAPGIYFARATTAAHQAVRKLVLH